MNSLKLYGGLTVALIAIVAIGVNLATAVMATDDADSQPALPAAVSNLAGFEPMSGGDDVITNAWYHSEAKFLIVERSDMSIEHCAVPKILWERFDDAESANEYYNRVFEEKWSCSPEKLPRFDADGIYVAPTTTVPPTTTTTTPRLTWCEQNQLWITEFDELMEDSAELSRSTAENLRDIFEDAAVRSSYMDSWNRVEAAFVIFDHAIGQELSTPAQLLEEAAQAKAMSARQTGWTFEAIEQNDIRAFEDWLNLSVVNSQDAAILFSNAIDAWSERCNE